LEGLGWASVLVASTASSFILNSFLIHSPSAPRIEAILRFLEVFHDCTARHHPFVLWFCLENEFKLLIQIASYINRYTQDFKGGHGGEEGGKSIKSWISLRNRRGQPRKDLQNTIFFEHKADQAAQEIVYFDPTKGRNEKSKSGSQHVVDEGCWRSWRSWKRIRKSKGIASVILARLAI
jgi:hypothetical protein